MDMRARDVCHHCGERVAGDGVVALLSGDACNFCCAGCAAAAQWIDAAGLDDYYRLRSADGARVDACDDDFAAWDEPDVLGMHSRAVGDAREITVLTDGMRCAACAWLIDRALRVERGVTDVGANAVTGRIRIVWDPARTALAPLLMRLAALGYRPYLAGAAATETARRATQRRELLRLGIAGLGAMQAMMFAEALYLDSAGTMPLATRDFLRWIAFLVSTPVVFYGGWPFLAGAWREWAQRRLGMDTLIAGSTLIAYGGSVVQMLRGGAHVWFDAAVMFVFLLLAARLVETRARAIANARVDALARARPAQACRERADGRDERVPVAALRHGDVVRVADGETLPADGSLLAPAAVDEALLTGESRALSRDTGDAVYAGSINRGGALRLRVTQIGSATRMAELVRLVETAQAQRPRVALLADRVASVFVAATILIALAVFAWWHMHAPERAFEVTLAVLVVTCPCALSLAIPAAFAAAHGALARAGVLALRPDALATLARAEVIVLDKTGTLSDGTPTLAGIETFGELTAPRALAIAAALERDCAHPLARAFGANAALATASDVRVVDGFGVEGDVDGRRWRLGRARFAAARDDDDSLWLGDGAQASARITWGEAARADAAAAIGALRANGLRVELLSGDDSGRVARFAATLGIAAALGRQSAQDKLAHVQALQARGEVVAMVGDGVNDGPVLAGADVSFALGDGTALAQRAADFVVTSPSLLALPRAFALARATRRVVRQNLAWAIGYNVIALPLAAAGVVGPALAAIGMALSSLFVTVNAMRLARELQP